MPLIEPTKGYLIRMQLNISGILENFNLNINKYT